MEYEGFTDIDIITKYQLQEKSTNTLYKIKSSIYKKIDNLKSENYIKTFIFILNVRQLNH